MRCGSSPHRPISCHANTEIKEKGEISLWQKKQEQ